MGSLNPPKSITWWIALILTALALLMHFNILTISVLAGYTRWMLIIAAVLLLVATRIRDL